MHIKALASNYPNKTKGRREADIKQKKGKTTVDEGGNRTKIVRAQQKAREAAVSEGLCGEREEKYLKRGGGGG